VLEQELRLDGSRLSDLQKRAQVERFQGRFDSIQSAYAHRLGRRSAFEVNGSRCGTTDERRPGPNRRSNSLLQAKQLGPPLCQLLGICGARPPALDSSPVAILQRTVRRSPLMAAPKATQTSAQVPTRITPARSPIVAIPRSTSSA
jgi:hypothetical protein